MTPDEERHAPQRGPDATGGRGAPPPPASAYLGFGMQFVAALLLFLFLGQWLDRRLGTSPVFLILGVFVGAGGAIYSMYRKLMADQKRREGSDPEARR